MNRSRLSPETVTVVTVGIACKHSNDNFVPNLTEANLTVRICHRNYIPSDTVNNAFDLGILRRQNFICHPHCSRGANPLAGMDISFDEDRWVVWVRHDFNSLEGSTFIRRAISENTCGLVRFCQLIEIVVNVDKLVVLIMRESIFTSL